MPGSPWQLMRELAEMQERMNRAWAAAHAEGPEGVTSRGAWTPAVDMYLADNKDLVVKVELPGLRREDIDVTVEHTTLTIRGERRREEGVPDAAYQRVERQYGAFARSFTLPSEVDPAGVRAEYREGVLTVRVPLRQAERERQIQVAIT